MAENRNTQTVVEAAYETNAPVRNTQIIGELAYATPAPVRMTQLLIELWHEPYAQRPQFHTQVI